MSQKENRSECTPSIKLSGVDQRIFSSLLEGLKKQGEDLVAEQLERVVVPLQLLDGTPEQFSFKGYPLPQPTYEQRIQMKLTDFSNIDINVLGGAVRVVIDEFGQIYWFYFHDMPSFYLLLKSSIDTAMKEI